MILTDLPTELLLHICEILYDLEYLNFLQQTSILMRNITKKIESKKGKKHPPLKYYIKDKSLIYFALYKFNINMRKLFFEFYVQTMNHTIDHEDQIIDMFLVYIGIYGTYDDFKYMNHLFDSFWGFYPTNEYTMLFKTLSVAIDSGNDIFMHEVKRLHPGILHSYLSSKRVVNIA